MLTPKGESDEEGAMETRPSGEPRFRVVIAGGGVAGLEALLALQELAGDRLEITLMSPDEEFHYRPLSVVEPFAETQPRSFSLRRIAAEHKASFQVAALEGINEEQRRITTSAGPKLEYDAVLIAIGAQPLEAVPGAITYRGSPDSPAIRSLIDEIDRGDIHRIAFGVPGATWWPIAAYELALLTSAHVRDRNLEGVEIHLVTAEPHALEIFGKRAGKAVAALLTEAGVELHTKAAPVSFEGGQLGLAHGRAVDCDRVVALPTPQVPAIAGLAGQDHRGLIPTDRFGQVLGMERVFAAGDATWFPIKQGGLAAQQADSAATAIAALAGAPIDPQPFRPVLRGALLTGGGPRYLRANTTGGRSSTAARALLWWPPSKIAGRLLAPYLAAKAGYGTDAKRPLADLDPPYGDDASQVASGHADAVELAYASADASARWHDYRGAMRWLEVAEDLELYLPPAYERKRISWQELARNG
jgi:sulfide:quinone oxidoreductase